VLVGLRQRLERRGVAGRPRRRDPGGQHPPEALGLQPPLGVEAGQHQGVVLRRRGQGAQGRVDPRDVDPEGVDPDEMQDLDVGRGGLGRQLAEDEGSGAGVAGQGLHDRVLQVGTGEGRHGLQVLLALAAPLPEGVADVRRELGGQFLDRGQRALGGAVEVGAAEERRGEEGAGSEGGQDRGRAHGPILATAGPKSRRNWRRPGDDQ
jgi:hypothetical protein